MAAEVPIITVELALVAIFSFTSIAPLGVPWWVPVIVVGVADGLVAALVRRVSERRRTGVWAGLAISGQELSDQQAVVIEKPRWNLTIFKVHFGHLTLKAYTKGERVLRFEAIVHHAKSARLRPQAGQVPGDHRSADRHGRPLHQHARLRRDRILARRHPRPAPRTLHTRSNQYRRDRHQHPPDSGRPCRRPRAGRRPARTHRRRVHRPSSDDHRKAPRQLQRPPGRLRPAQATRQTARPQLGCTRHYHVPEASTRTITALPTLREKVITPLLAGIRTPGRGRPPKTWTNIDRDYETIRLNMQPLLNDLGIATKATAASTTICRLPPATL